MDDTAELLPKAESDSGKEQGAEAEVRLIPIDRIKPSPHQVRDTFDPEFLEGMSHSLKEKGLVQPILVQKMGDDFELVSGEQRLRAAKLAGSLQIEARVLHKQLTPLEASVLGLVENLQRKELNPIEMARGIKRLMTGFNLSQAEVASQLRISKSAVSRALAMLDFPPEVQESLERGQINSRHVRAVVGLRSAEDRTALLKQAAEEQWSSEETQRRARKTRSRPARVQGKGDGQGAVSAQPPIVERKGLEAAALHLLAKFVEWLIHLRARASRCKALTPRIQSKSRRKRAMFKPRPRRPRHQTTRRIRMGARRGGRFVALGNSGVPNGCPGQLLADRLGPDGKGTRGKGPKLSTAARSGSP